MKYTLLVRYTKTYDKYVQVEANSEEEAVTYVTDHESYPVFDIAMTQKFDSETVDTEAYVCCYQYDKILDFDELLQNCYDCTTDEDEENIYEGLYLKGE